MQALRPQQIIKEKIADAVSDCDRKENIQEPCLDNVVFLYDLFNVDGLEDPKRHANKNKFTRMLSTACVPNSAVICPHSLPVLVRSGACPVNQPLKEKHLPKKQKVPLF